MSEQWVRTSFNFGGTVACIEIPCQEPLGIGVLVKEHQGDPEELAKALAKVIGMFRPELAGGTVEAMEMNFGLRRWAVFYSHPSLKRVSVGAMCPTLSLATCPQCGKDVLREAWLATSQGQIVTTCGKECADLWVAAREAEASEAIEAIEAATR